MKYSRRKFVAASGLLAASGLAVPAPVRSASAARLGAGDKPRHIIHLVSDGMSMGTLTCADQFSSLVRQRPLVWTTLYDRADAVTALVNMRSLNSLVTDSAAAASSWGCGSRVVNGALNQLPDGRDLKPLCTLLGEAGWARGLVTTTEITHATPAGFASNVANRDMAETIAEQYLERRIEVLLGGGRKFFTASSRNDKRDLKADYAGNGYAVLETRTALSDAPSTKRWLGVFDSGHLPYTIDQRGSEALQARVPTLAEMTAAALRRLESEPHFVLQVEGGRVDHAAHASDAAAAMWDQLAFDEALEVCLEFQQRDPSTLIVVTTDHGNANLGLNGMGSSYGQSSPMFSNLTRVRKSFSALESDFGGARRNVTLMTAGDVAALVGEATGCEISNRHAAMFARFLAGDHAPLYDQMNGFSAQMGQLLANHLGIGWTGTSHTADYVTLVAMGPGAGGFRGMLQGTDVFHRYVELAGIRFRNPELPLMAESGPTAAEVEGLG
jgi:alkaline phosphatase